MQSTIQNRLSDREWGQSLFPERGSTRRGKKENPSSDNLFRLLYHCYRASSGFRILWAHPPSNLAQVQVVQNDLLHVQSPAPRKREWRALLQQGWTWILRARNGLAFPQAAYRLWSAT